MININVNTNLYKTFLEVYSIRNISKAAKKLSISQSAISQNIKTLENQLDVKLFKISTKTICPTVEADMIYEDVKKALNILTECEGRLKISQGNYSGTINIGIQSFLFNSFLIDKLIAYRKLHPAIKFNIVSKSTSNMLKMIVDDNVDFVVDCSPINNENASIKVEQISVMDNCFITNKQDLRESITVEQLKNENLIFSSKNSKSFVELKKIIDIPDNAPIIYASSTENIVSLVSRGEGIGYILCDKDNLQIYDKNIKAIQTNKPLPLTEIYLCYNPALLNVIAKDFIDFIVNYK